METTDLKVPVFRAITGKEFGDRFPGVSDEQLRALGAFVPNLSDIQTDIEAWYASHEGMAGRRVEGLPVFLNRAHAESWLNGKNFKNSPVVAEIDIPLSLIEDGTVLLIQNGPRKENDRKLDKDILLAHLSGTEIKGEWFLTGPNPLGLIELLKPHERFFRPHLASEGLVDTSRGYYEVKLEPEITESTTEINKA